MIDDFFSAKKNIFTKKKLVVLLLADAWGVSLNDDNNAIRKAKIPAFKNLVANYPTTVIEPPGFDDSKNYRIIGSSHHNLESKVPAHLSLSKIISQHQMSQLKIAPSSTFPLISVFLNGQEDRFLGEDWRILPNKKDGFFDFLKGDGLDVSELIKSIKSDKYNFITSSWPDISQGFFKGDFSRTVSAVEKVAIALSKVAQAVLSVDGVLLFTSSYGGAEDVFNIQTNLANKKRTSNSVPFLIIGREYEGKTIGLKEAPNNDISLLSPQGSYLDIAPTILRLLNLEVPQEMQGKSFV